MTRLRCVLLGSKFGPQMASRSGRFIKYPQMARRAQGDVFHVMDHSHANLVAALDVDKTVLTCHDIIPYLAALGKIPIPGRSGYKVHFSKSHHADETLPVRDYHFRIDEA